MYPRLCDGVELGSYTTEESPELQYYAINPEGDEFSISKSIFSALRNADGTAPLNLPSGLEDELLQELVNANLVTIKRLVWEGLWNRLILFPVGRRGRRCRGVASVLNKLLPKASLSLFLLGVLLSFYVPVYSYEEFNSVLYYLALVLSLSLHEFGHFNAAIAYRHKVSDVGILLLGIIPLGAYVAYIDKKESNKRRLQIALAGIEMNLLCAGVCLLLRYCIPSLSFTLLMIAIMNSILAGINLLPAGGLDGEAALSALLHVKSISNCAKRLLSSKKHRRKLLSSGASGYMYFGILCNTYLAKGIVAVLIINDFINIVKGFI